MSMICPTCGEELHKIEGLYYDRDGIRNARFCSLCGVIYGVHAAGFSKQFSVYNVQESDTCPACDGKGKITCPACVGRGKLHRKEK